MALLHFALLRRRHFAFVSAMSSVVQDLRYALRGLRRAPTFTAIAIATLGLGLGANVAMFAIIDRVMYRPFPYMRDASSVDRVYLQTTTRGVANADNQFFYARYLDLMRNTTSFSAMAAMSEWRLAVGSGDATTVRKVAAVSASFFGFFYATPIRGRWFGAAEDVVPIGSQVAVIAEHLWRDVYGGADVIGTMLKIGTLDYRIIGVAPKGFEGTVQGAPPDVFVPITTIAANLGTDNTRNYWSTYTWDFAEVIARRKPGVSDAQANADLTHAYVVSRAAARGINPRITPDSIAHPRGIAGSLRTAAGPTPGTYLRVLLWTGGVAFVVLLIACASVANLMIARLVRRQREIVLRLALGVTPGRLLSQLVTESIVVAFAGLVAALFVAQWSGAAIHALLMPSDAAFSLWSDWRTFAFGAVCATACTLFTSIGPMLMARRADLAVLIKSGGREGGRGRSSLQSTLLVVQVSLSVVLLVGAGLFVRSLNAVHAIPAGYEAASVIEATLDWRNTSMTPVTRADAQQRMLLAARALPGVEAVAEAQTRLFSSHIADLRVPGIDSVGVLGRFGYQVVSADYFDVLKVRMQRGRHFDAGDRTGAPLVAVVSASMAARLWPGRDPIGRCLHVKLNAQANDTQVECTTVVGVADDVRQASANAEPLYGYYLLKDQFMPMAAAPLLLRVTGSDATLHLERIRRELTRAMPGDGHAVVRPLQSVVDNQTRAWRLGTTLFAAFGLLALLVASVGLYGVVSYGVAGRTHELGVRCALGARTYHIVTLVVSHGVRFASVGVAIGGIVALLASRWLEPLLFRVSGRDSLTYVSVIATMLAVATLASLLPALRAARTSPMLALRSD